MTEPRESGFTLPELIMSITILGIIAVVIGGVLVAAFSSTSGINDRFDASRASKQAALYWTPDAQSTETLNPAGVVCGHGLGSAPTALVTFFWTDHPSVTDVDSPVVDAGTPRVATWWLEDEDQADQHGEGERNPARIVRRICNGNALATPIETQRIASRMADRSGGVAALAESASDARAQLSVECSNDGTSFHGCTTDDPSPVVRLTARVLDVPAPSAPGEPDQQLFKTYEFQVAEAREVR